MLVSGSPCPLPSQFRLQKLLQDLTAAGVPARAISAEFVHVVETSRSN
jgi:phosphoribosylformylglycinamidine synthase